MLFDNVNAPLHGAEQSGVLREDLNFRGFHSLTLTMLALLLLFKLSIANYGDYQFSTPPFFVSKNLQKTYKSPASQNYGGIAPEVSNCSATPGLAIEAKS